MAEDAFSDRHKAQTKDAKTKRQRGLRQLFVNGGRFVKRGAPAQPVDTAAAQPVWLCSARF